MTEKRYILSHNGKEDGILDKTNDKGYYGFELAQLVNEFSEENKELKKENKQLKEIFIEQLETALTIPFIRKEYCNALLRVLDEEDSLESAKEYIKNFLGVSE